ncbi:bifunctional enoyl-CoA hydratase/phosphate acetyltransferase [Maledivibacter halophilus]|uniref:Phosphate butyryltransferase n=1 Tax=Maledivibacter halophilus TaxID=36842 RepID=A0A1T5KGN4_9FIRM|nr:bifunctional enoyl-CoA hydratase/phosphate acetyltransferase [Maledivibacter halophilus]SKC62872.1 phosphate butyryltransferase [Maledivibacter halophilus]
MINNLEEVVQKVKGLDKKKIAIASADSKILEVVELAVQDGLAEFILIGNKEEIESAIEKDNRKIDCEIIDILDDKAAAEKAVELVKKKEADIVMKGLLHTSTFLKAVLNKEKGLNTGKLISEISVIDKEYGEGLQLVTDCAMAIKPDLKEKKQIIENAIFLAKKLGYTLPKVALLSALEVINPAIPDTIDAAVLSKMADRGQIKDALVDGPLALDNAINPEAAKHKGIKGEVAGNADIIVVPNLQVGNVLGKSLFFYAHKDAATAIVGTSAPIIMTSRTDLIKNKLLSIALASYMA